MSSIKLEKYLQKGPKQLFEQYKEEFYDHLSSYDSWKVYLNDHLNQSKDFRFDKSYFIEQNIQHFRKLIFKAYFSRSKDHIFFQQFEPLFDSKYSEFLQSLDHYEKFYITSSRGARRISVELFNIRKEDLYYPNIQFLYNVHSALHSIALSIFLIKNDEYNHNCVLIYFEPLLSHPIDRAYVTYLSQILNLPLIIGKRQETLAWLLQKNRVPKVGKLGRWCSRIFKVEVNELITKKFFLQKMRYKDLNTKFMISDWDSKQNKWIETDLFLSNVPIYKKIYSKIGNVKKLEGYINTDETISANNVVNMIGITKYQSKSRAKQNPNLTYHKITKIKRRYNIFRYYPIFHKDFKDFINIVKSYRKKIRINPYDKEFGGLFVDREGKRNEVRFGCIFCPYKQGDYYLALKEKFPEAYYYCHLLRVIASAYNIIEQDREYYYFTKKDTPKSHPEWLFVI